MYPEIVLLVMACVVTLADLFVKSPKRTGTYVLTLASLGGVALLHAMYADAGQTLYGFGRMVVSDPMGHWLKCFATIAVMVTLVYSRPYAADRDMMRGGEIFSLSLYALLVMSMMISGQNFIVIYLGLELLTLSSYALVALRRDHTQATEAAMKYFVLGAMASGFLLYGMSMMYGATGNLDLRNIADAVGSGQIDFLPLAFGVVFIVAGLAFKLGAVPFHMWVPDVYQGAPTAVTLVLAAAPKLAVFAIVVRMLIVAFGDLAVHWQPMLLILGVLSLAIGNLTAIMQTNFKRMLAYSTIAHMGFVMLGLASGSLDGDIQADTSAYGSALFYMLTYVLTTLASFGLMMYLSREGFECENIDDLKGLNRRSPWLAAMMLILMCSLAGLPPLVGFDAKLLILQALLQSDRLWLAVVAVLFSLIGAFYYLRVIKVVYFDEPAEPVTPVPAMGLLPNALLLVNGLLVLIIGLMPGGLIALCLQVMHITLSY